MQKWVEEITEKVIEENEEKNLIVCQCGISTTGIAHLGNFRELIITYFISEALKIKGKDTKVILSFDDFDRLKKINAGTPKEYEKYIGMPDYSFPSPIDKSIGYAQYYENKVKDELDRLGIKMNYIYQSNKYLKGDYNEYIKETLDKRYEIFDIVKKYKTQKLDDTDKVKYYPIKIYCSKCNKDSTTILEYDKDSTSISYECKCGFHEKKSINDLKIKMNFNVEWSMRWNIENVDFESCGKGHAERLGALNVAKDINKNIYNGINPVTLSYQFVNLKGTEGRMNKNSKNIITISDLLEVMPKEIILYLFLINPPNKEMSFSFDDIPSIYKQYEKFINDNDNLDDLQLLKVSKSNISNLKFTDIIHFLQIANFNLNNLRKYIEFDSNNKNDLEKIRYAAKWLKKYRPNDCMNINKTSNMEYWDMLPENRKEYILKFSDLLKNGELLKEKDSINNFFNDNCIKNKKEFFTDFYNLVFRCDKGIPLKTLIENFNIIEIIELLDSYYAQNNISNKKLILK